MSSHITLTPIFHYGLEFPYTITQTILLFMTAFINFFNGYFLLVVFFLSRLTELDELGSSACVPDPFDVESYNKLVITCFQFILFRNIQYSITSKIGIFTNHCTACIKLNVKYSAVHKYLPLLNYLRQNIWNGNLGIIQKTSLKVMKK